MDRLPTDALNLPGTSTEVLSFRHLLTGAIEDFLGTQGMSSGDFANDVSETIVALSRYREEGTALFPAVFFCDDLPCLLGQLGGRDPVVVGAGPRSALTTRRALKQCAPLGKGAWSIFLVRGATDYRYGVFRADDFVLGQSPLSRLRGLRDPSLCLLGIVQLAENVLEVRGSGGAGRLVHLSGARTDAPPATTFLNDLVRAITRDVPGALRPATGTFFRRVLIDALRSTHGSLIAVLPAGERDLAPYADGLLLSEPLDVVASVGRWQRDGSIDARSAVALDQLALEGEQVEPEGQAHLDVQILERNGGGVGEVHGPQARQVGLRRVFQIQTAQVGAQVQLTGHTGPPRRRRTSPPGRSPAGRSAHPRAAGPGPPQGWPRCAGRAPASSPRCGPSAG